MKNIARLLFLFAVFSFGLTACSKEKKMENQLERGSGKWNIRRLYYEELTASTEGGKDHLDVGSFEFNKDKTIVKTFDFNQTKTITTGTWVTDEYKITITWSDGKTSTLHISKAPKKGKMTLYESYTISSSSGWGPGSWSETTYEYTYYLERAH
jgi:hypothetical protein